MSIGFRAQHSMNALLRGLLKGCELWRGHLNDYLGGMEDV